MKKTISICITTGLLTLAIMDNIHAQTSNEYARYTTNPSPDKNVSPGEFYNSNKILNSGFLNDINIKAVQHFMNTYENASDIRWTKLKNGFRVYFISDDIQTRIIYSKKGAPESIIRYYGEDKLLFDIRHRIKTQYYDYSISIVTEVNYHGKIAYLVKMENKISWKTIKVVDGEMEVTEEYLKDE